MTDLQKPARGNNPALPEIPTIERQRERWLLANTRARGPLTRTIAALFWDALNRRGRV